MWDDFVPPSLPLSNENNRGSYHNSLPLRMEEVIIHTILYASCRMGAEQSLVLLLMRMGNGCWCKPIVLTENWGRIRPRQIHFHCYNMAVTTTVIATSYIIMIIRSQFLSLSSPHPQPQFLIVSTWSWELVRGGGNKKSLLQKNVRRCHSCDAGSSFLVFLVCCCVMYHDVSLFYCTDDWRWPRDLKLKFIHWNWSKTAANATAATSLVSGGLVVCCWWYYHHTMMILMSIPSPIHHNALLLVLALLSSSKLMLNCLASSVHHYH